MFRARELDPLSLIIRDNYGWMLYFARRSDHSIEQFRTNLAIDPDFARSRFKLVRAYAQAGRYEEAIGLFDDPVWAKAARAAYREEGAAGFWRRRYEMLKPRAQGRPARALEVARVCARLGRRDEAFGWLEQALRERDRLLLFLKVDPDWDPLCPEERFADLTRRVGLPQ